MGTCPNNARGSPLPAQTAPSADATTMTRSIVHKALEKMADA
jgi:hypothetical protein